MQILRKAKLFIFKAATKRNKDSPTAVRKFLFVLFGGDMAQGRIQLSHHNKHFSTLKAKSVLKTLNIIGKIWKC